MSVKAKPGWKTSEFWVTGGTSIIALAVLGGVFESADAEAVTSGLKEVVASVFIAITNVSYIISRTKLKGETPPAQ